MDLERAQNGKRKAIKKIGYRPQTPDISDENLKDFMVFAVPLWPGGRRGQGGRGHRPDHDCRRRYSPYRGCPTNPWQRCFATSRLGDVMKESIQAAEGFTKSRAAILVLSPICFKRDIHVHVPEGTTQKDGLQQGWLW